ncbi:RsfA family transcriptional regulator [Paenibacillus sp. LK1]|uniref:RsfA family transcriptional regulator n=1 Tax=Paenibacillus sp. LK1 TaxID=2053014 RepID=UPI000C1763E6|nr:RsfA family transcriptional regulator [Paenibacillus sp. LK1]PIH59116.1 RsfA family transcriptional regulator [Paenibacillus sp. LK1]
MIRKDSWNADEDKLLATIVLNYITTGETQLKAFYDVGLELDRTAAACGFRWNSYLRQKYIEEIIEAKHRKLSNKRSSIKSPPFTLNIEYIVEYLQALKQDLILSEAQIRLIKVKIQDVSSEIDSRRSEMSLDASQNRDALAALIAKASELGLFEHNKKPAI